MSLTPCPVFRHHLNTGWQTFSFTATDAGNYDLGIGVVDSGSSLGTSLFYIDWLVII